MAAVPQIAPAFSTSALRLKQSQELDVVPGQLEGELAAKLQSEIDLEKEALEAEDNALEQSIKESLVENEWKVENKEGSEEVTLRRQFGNDKYEALHPLFS